MKLFTFPTAPGINLVNRNLHSISRLVGGAIIIIIRRRKMECVSPTQPVHDHRSGKHAEANQAPSNMSQETIDEIKHRFFESQPVGNVVKQKSLTLLALELHIDMLFARTQVSIQMRRFEQASHSLDEAIQIARLIGDRQLKGRCDFWIGAFAAEEGDRAGAAENFLKAIEIVGTDCPEAQAEAKMLQRYLTYIKLFLEQEANGEVEAHSTMKLLQAVISEFVSEEDQKALTPLSVAESRISWPSNVSWSQPRYSQSFIQNSVPDSVSPGARNSMSLDSHSAFANRSSRFSRPISMISNSTRGSFVPIDRFLEDLLNPDHDVDAVNRELRNHRRPVDQTRTARRSILERLRLEGSDEWPSESLRRTTDGIPEESKPSTLKEAQLSDTLAPEELDRRVEMTIGRRKSVGLTPINTNSPAPEAAQIYGTDNNQTPVRRRTADPPISSPLRRGSLPGDEDA